MSMPYYFDYNGKKYQRNTVVKFNRDFMISKFSCDHVIAKAFVGHEEYYCFMLIGVIDPITNQELLISITRNEIKTAIEEIIEPHEAQIYNAMQSTEKYHDWDYPGLIEGWIIYIFFMCLWSIFKDAFGFWILTSIVFFNWRHNKLKPYKK